MKSSISERHHVLACATTLHVTLLTSHYTAAPQRDDAAAASSNNAAAGHRREVPPSTKASSSTTTKVPGSEEVEVYSCITPAEQLDTVARVLCAILRQQSSASEGGVTDAAQRVQMAKATRDNVVPWIEVAAAQGDDSPVLRLSRRPSNNAVDSCPSLPPLLPVTASSSSAGGGKEGEPQRRAAGNDCRSAPQQQRQVSGRPSPSRSSMRSSSTVIGSQHHVNEVERVERETYLARELPPCELVMIPGETPASSPAYVIFVYRLSHEEDVVAQLLALFAQEKSCTAEKTDVPAVDTMEPLGTEKSCVFQAAAIVTRALWSTIRPILRDHLQATNSSVVPAHVPVVWAIADPRMLSGFLPYTSDSTGSIFSPYACPVSDSPSSMRGPDEAAGAERWVRLVPRTAFYLYDPSTSSTAVQETLGVLQSHLAEGTQSQASSPRGSLRLSSVTTGKPMPPQRGGANPQTTAVTKGTRPSGSSTSGSRGSKGRNSRGAAGAAGSGALTASAAASSVPHQTALQLRQMGLGIGLKAVPAEFPYCSTNARSLGYYLYSGSVASAPSPPQVLVPAALSPLSVDLEGELTAYLSKMVAFQQAVMTASEANIAGSSTEGAFERMWCAHAPLLRWVQRYLSNAAAALTANSSPVEQVSSDADGYPGTEHHRLPVAVEDVVRLSLSQLLPDDSRWPLPLWKVAALPIPPVPPVTLRCRGSDDGVTPASVAKNSIVQWAADVLSVVLHCGNTEGDVKKSRKTPLIPLLKRLVRLIDAYNGWALKYSLTPARGPSNNSRNGKHGAATQNAAGEHSVDGPVAVQRSTASACCTGGVFNIMSAVYTWTATVSESLLLKQNSCEFTALCATAESPVSYCAGGHPASSTATVTSVPSSGLFRRYAQPFQKLLAPSCGGAKTPVKAGTLAAIVPRLPTTAEAPISEVAATAAQSENQRTVTTPARIHHQSADTVVPPCPQEVSWMVRHIIAKNAGHFEVNVARGTDTVTPTAARMGLSPPMLDLGACGSSSLATRQSTMATMTMATPSTELLLQQQRRRLRWQTSSVPLNLQLYSQGVHLIKEMARILLGRRPQAEAAVALQGALESTLAPRQCEVTTGKGCGEGVSAPSHQSQEKHRGMSASASATGTEQVGALDLLRRYLRSVDPMHARVATTSKPVTLQRPAVLPELHHSKENKESEMLATQAAAENLMPRIYEHTLQQAFLYQILQETGLEATGQSASLRSHRHNFTAAREEDICANGDWSVTQQLPVHVIASSIVDFQERFGIHNVAWRSCALHYRPLQPQTATSVGTADKGVDATASQEENKDAELHCTSAYAHNALNVHPARRVTHIWVAGVAAPDVQTAEYMKKRKGPNSEAKAGQNSRPSLGQQRSRRWVDMTPRAGTVTSVEIYALWQWLLQQQQSSTAKTAPAKHVGVSMTDARAQLRVGPAELTMQAMHDLISQYVQRHAEVSTSLVGLSGVSSTHSEHTAATESSPMLFDVHETLYPYSDAVLEVWVSKARRLCRYIKATEVIATLHAMPSSTGISNMRLNVHWDDGLLFVCTCANNKEGGKGMVPPIDVTLTTCNAVLQQRHCEPLIRLCRYPNTSSSTTAASAASLKERIGQQAVAVPQGGVMETCAALLEECVTLYCVHHCPTELTAETWVELEASSEKETSCEVDERTGVVRRCYASGMQQLLFPSGAIMVRRPLAPIFAKSSVARSTLQYCDTLVTLDGQYFVRNGSSSREPSSASTSLGGSRMLHTSEFQRVQARLARANCNVMGRGTGADDAHSPHFMHTEITYDAVNHCHMRSRQDGLTLVEYESLAPYSDTVAKQNGGHQGSSLARVVVFPDGITITTVASREARRRALVCRPDGTSMPTSLSSPTLCALLEELQAVEDSLFGTADDAADLSVRWCVEASTMPRVYLAPARTGGNDEERECKAAFAVVLGDGTVLQRRWAASPTLPEAFSSVGAEVNTNEEDGVEGGAVGEGGVHSAPVPRGGTLETVLIRPSGSAVRLLHHHAIATIEPSDVLARITHASPAAYAVGQGLVFFDLACGGGLRMVDSARCVWEVRGLAEANDGPQVLYPERPSTYEELLRALVSPHYSPHRLPRAAQLMYAREQRQEAATYARQRATGWCPPLLRRMREIAEPFIRAAQLLRTDVLAPIEAATAAAEEGAFLAVSAPNTANVAGVKRGAMGAAKAFFSSAGIAHKCMSRVLPICFGQLDNGEAIRYWNVSEVLPSPSESCALSTPATTSEPEVIQRLVPGIATGSVLGYISTAPRHTFGADVIGVLLCGHPAETSLDCSVLWQRLVTVTRLSLLFSGVLAPAIPPAMRLSLPASCDSDDPSASPANSSAYTASLPPLAVLLHHGSRWLPPTLQPPQQFGAYQRKRPTVGAGTAAEYVDVAWVRDSTATLSIAAANTAYVQYVTDQVNPLTAVRTSRTELQREVARRELRRHEQLAQLSHYHRVLNTQWPMEMPASAQEAQVRLEMRFKELQQGLQSAVPPPAAGNHLSFPSAIDASSRSDRIVV